jgi:hypothetical protein
LNPKENHMPGRRIPVDPFPTGSTADEPGATPQTRNAQPAADDAAVEAIAERRAMALELRKAGGSYREIARQLSVDVHTVHGDVAAELAALRETTVGRAEELRALELERFDRMIAGLWPQIQKVARPPSRRRFASVNAVRDSSVSTSLWSRRANSPDR